MYKNFNSNFSNPKGIWFRTLNDKFKSPYIGIWLFWKPCLVVNTPELARNVLVKDFGNFRDRYLSSGETDPIGSLNVFTLNVSTHYNICNWLYMII